MLPIVPVRIHPVGKQDQIVAVGGGSILGGLILGSIGVFIIDRQFTKAAAFSAAGAVLTFFGFMHGHAIGIAQTPLVAASYLIMGGVLFACAKFATVSAPAPEPAHEEEELPSGTTEAA